MKEVTFCFTSHNHLSLVRSTLESFFEKVDIECDVIVVDNGSTDGTKEYLLELQRRYPNMTVILLPKNYYVSRADNTAVAAARTEFVWVLHTDMTFGDSFASAMLAAYKADPGSGIAYPRNASCTNNTFLPFVRRKQWEVIREDEEFLLESMDQDFVIRYGQMFPEFHHGAVIPESLVYHAGMGIRKNPDDSYDIAVEHRDNARLKAKHGV